MTWTAYIWDGLESLAIIGFAIVAGRWAIIRGYDALMEMRYE